MTLRTVPSDPRQAVAYFEGTAARRPAAADHDQVIIYAATDDGVLSIGAGGRRTMLADQTVASAPFVTTAWHSRAAAVTATASVQSTLYAVPYVAPAGATTITGLSVQCTTLASGSTVRLGVYARAADGTVGARLLDAGTVATTSTGVKSITSLTLAVPASRRVFLVAVGQGGTPAFNFAGAPEAVPQATPDNSLGGLYIPTATGVTGALGASFTIAAFVASAPHIAVQLA